jgi:hypothetical protein
VLAFALALGEPGCKGQPGSPRFAVQLRARTPGGQAVAGVRAWADGRALGATSELGLLGAGLHGREGGAVELSTACPPAYRTEPASRRLILRRVHGAAVSTGGTDELELDVRCVPIETSAALIVLASSDLGRAVDGLPVRVQDEVIGQIERDGSAHLLVTAPANTTLRVQIDTSAHPELLPRSPVHSFRMQDDTTLLLVEQRFAPAPRARRTPRAAPPPPAPRKPQRIE